MRARDDDNLRAQPTSQSVPAPEVVAYELKRLILEVRSLARATDSRPEARD